VVLVEDLTSISQEVLVLQIKDLGAVMVWLVQTLVQVEVEVLVLRDKMLVGKVEEMVVVVFLPTSLAHRLVVVAVVAVVHLIQVLAQVLMVVEMVDQEL
jgi:hypothetical protein